MQLLFIGMIVIVLIVLALIDWYLCTPTYKSRIIQKWTTESECYMYIPQVLFKGKVLSRWRNARLGKYNSCYYRQDAIEYLERFYYRLRIDLATQKRRIDQRKKPEYFNGEELLLEYDKRTQTSDKKTA